MKCSRTGCGQDATCAPQILFPAPVQFQDAPPVRAIMALPCCDTHCNTSSDPGDFMFRSHIEGFADAVAASGKVRPDTSRVSVKPIALTDPDYLRVADSMFGIEGSEVPVQDSASQVKP